MPDLPLDVVLREARARLAEAGVTGPDAELLAAWATGRTPGELRLAALVGTMIDADAQDRFRRALARRAAREPLQRITGIAPFRHLELRVGPGVFTPRPETELLVDVALAHLAERASGPGGAHPLVLDVGTGSGAVAIAIATESDARVVAVEASPAAYTWARANVAALAPGVALVHADGRDEAALAEAGIGPGALDALVSNPPYVPGAAIPADAEVREHDPAAALHSGADGLDLIRDLAPLAARLLRPGGLVALEHAEHQGAAIRAILAAAGLREARTIADLTGRDRVTAAVR